MPAIASVLVMSAQAPPALEPKVVRPRRFKMARTIIALMLREMSTTYGRNPGGYLWAILEPVAAIVVLTFGFALIMRSPPLGTSFILFFATGYLPYGMYTGLAQVCGSALKFSRALLSYPGVTVIDALLARFVLKVLTQVMIFYIVITGVLITQDTGNILYFPAILTSLALTASLGLGVGAMNSVLLGVFPPWKQLWAIITRPLLFVSGVLLLPENLPASVQEILWFNPLVHVTGLMRKGFYANYGAEYVSLTYGFGFAAVLLAFGIFFLNRYHKDILKL